MQIIHHEILDSTNDEAKRILSMVECDTVVVADVQTKGRGSRGKNWSSDEKGNLYISMITKLEWENYHVSLLSSIFVHQALQFFNQDAQLKWPNDIYIEGAKVGGILIEKEGDFYIIGIGVNLVSAPVIENYPTTTLSTLNVDRDLVLNKIIDAFQKYRHEPIDKLSEIWCEYCAHINKSIDLSPYGCGVFLRIDEKFNPIFQR